MEFLIVLVLPKEHEGKRDRVLAATLTQLATDHDPVALMEESGFRLAQRADGPVEVFRMLKVRIDGAFDTDRAGACAAAAVRAGNSKLRLLGLPPNIQISVFVQPPAVATPDEATER